MYTHKNSFQRKAYLTHMQCTCSRLTFGL